MIAPGDRVIHLRFGRGTVLSLAFGYRARVRFDNAPDLPRTVSRQSLRPDFAPAAPPPTRAPGPSPASAIEVSSRATPASVEVPGASVPAVAPARRGSGRASVTVGLLESEAPAATAPEAAASLPAPLPRVTSIADDRREAAELWQTIEALRLGVVPARHLAEYTVGRARELSEIASVFEARQGFRAVWGDYGAGKTHFLEVLEQEALKRGFVTSRIVLDPLDTPPTHPKRLYRALVEALTLPGGEVRGLDHLLDQLAESDLHVEPRSRQWSRFYSPYLLVRRLGNEEAVESLRDYVLGEAVDPAELVPHLRAFGFTGERPLTLSDFRTYGRVYIHLIGTIAAWAKDAGYQGLVLLFDEVEGISLLDATERRYALEVLSHFAAVTAPPALLRFRPERDLYKGGHMVHRQLPLRFRPDQPLIAIFGLTPLQEIKDRLCGIVAPGLLDITLRDIDRREVRSLPGRILRLYGRAYPGFRADEALEGELVREIDGALRDGEGSPRELVRLIVFRLDVERFSGRR